MALVETSITTSKHSAADRVVRVAFVGTRGIPARYGGFETFVQELATRWSKVPGFEITVVCPREPVVAPLEHLGAVQLQYVSQANVGPATSILYDIRSVASTVRNHDVIYILGVGAAFAGILPRMLGKKVWINPDGLEWKRSKWSAFGRGYLRLMERVASAVADVLIADAHALGAYLRSTYGDGVRTVCIPYGASIPEVSEFDRQRLPEGLSPHAYNLLVARLEPENKVLEIIEGYGNSDQSRPLVVVGNVDPGRAYVRELLTLAAHDPRVRFIGGVYDQKALTALRGLARHAFHGHSVGGTNPSLLEALACGNLVVAHANPFNREVGGELMQYFTEASDIPAALSRFEAMSHDQRQDLAERARARIREAYAWDGVTAAYAALARATATGGERTTIKSRF